MPFDNVLEKKNEAKNILNVKDAFSFFSYFFWLWERILIIYPRSLKLLSCMYKPANDHPLPINIGPCQT